MFKSNMVFIYNEVYKQNQSQKVIINDKLAKICKYLDDSEFYDYINSEQKNFFDEIIKPVIYGNKEINYVSMLFFLPLIYKQNKIIFNKYSREYLPLENDVDGYIKTVKSNLSVLKERCLISLKHMNPFNKNDGKLFTDKLNNVFVVGNRIEIGNLKEFLEERKKTIDIEKSSDIVKKLDIFTFDFLNKTIYILKEDKYNQFIEMYKRIWHFKFNKLVRERNIIEKINVVGGALIYLPEAIQSVLISKIEKILIEEMNYEKQQYSAGELVNLKWLKIKLDNAKFLYEYEKELVKEYEEKYHGCLDIKSSLRQKLLKAEIELLNKKSE